MVRGSSIHEATVAGAAWHRRYEILRKSEILWSLRAREQTGNTQDVSSMGKRVPKRRVMDNQTRSCITALQRSSSSPLNLHLQYYPLCPSTLSQQQHQHPLPLLINQTTH